MDMAIPRELFRKYIAYSKQRIVPKLGEEAVEKIKKFYIELRNSPVSSEAASRPIPISARQLEAIIRLSEAHAKLRLSKEVKRDDARKAIELLKISLTQVGYDEAASAFSAAGGVVIAPSVSDDSSTFHIWCGSMPSWSGSIIPVLNMTNDPEEDFLPESMHVAEKALTHLDALGVVRTEYRLVYYVPTGEYLERTDSGKWRKI